MNDIIVGLDIGTSYIKVVIGELNLENQVKIIGYAKRPSRGLRKGVIVSINDAMDAIKETIDEAEQMAGVEVQTVFTAIGGSQVEGRGSSGNIGVDPSGHNRALEISETARLKAIESARAVAPPLGQEPIHVIPQEYKVDENPGFRDPIGILGVRLEASVYIVTASKSARANIENCIHRSGYELGGIMLKTLAAALATLHSEERELGSIVIDLGSDSTDVIIINKDAPVFITSIPVGGNFVTNDIAQVKGISYADAEIVKQRYGCCWIEGNEQDEEVIIQHPGGQPPEQTTRYELCEIIQPRMDEIFSMVKKEVVHHSGLTKLNGNIVLTGGGARMPGVEHLAQSVWRTTAIRIGEAPNMGNLDGDESELNTYQQADFATAVGLVRHFSEKLGGDVKHHSSKKSESKGNDGHVMDGVKSFLKKFF